MDKNVEWRGRKMKGEMRMERRGDGEAKERSNRGIIEVHMDEREVGRER